MSEENKLNITVAEGVSELILRQGEAPKVLDPLPPLKIDLSGVISTPYDFLQQRHETNQFEHKLSHIVIDREKVTISLVINENNDRTIGKVNGKLEAHPKFIEFGINDANRWWEPIKLGQFFKMNRAFFEDRDYNMELVSNLKNFEATIDSRIEQAKNENGSMKDNYEAQVASNIPGKFKVNIPLFKGFPKEILEVEFDFSVSGRTVVLQLVSPDAAAMFEEIRDSIIDEQINAIKALTPGILIIEK